MQFEEVMCLPSTSNRDSRFAFYPDQSKPSVLSDLLSSFHTSLSMEELYSPSTCCHRSRRANALHSNCRTISHRNNWSAGASQDLEWLTLMFILYV